MHKHSSAVKAAADRGHCRTVEAVWPIGWQVVWSPASHWHVSFSSLFSRWSSSRYISPCLSASPFPLVLLVFSGINIGCSQVPSVYGGTAVEKQRQEGGK
ncbi:hypothetical protein VZT92_024747 [Zoarces viviparus]|uniref:Uncharacterized protein n=1 Tax=Zoarces viviparus TaxID=48416 RepID=A0AAW1E425_ZOAVI